MILFLVLAALACGFFAGAVAQNAREKRAVEAFVQARLEQHLKNQVIYSAKPHSS